MSASTQTVQVLSFATGLFAYALLMAFSVVTLVRGITGKALFTATLLTFCFLVLLTYAGYTALTHIAELMSLYAWFFLLIRAIGLRKTTFDSWHFRSISTLAVIGTIALFAGCFAALSAQNSGTSAQGTTTAAIFIANLLLSVSGLVAIEQLARNTREDLRWRLRYLNIGLSLIFAFGLLKSAINLLFTMNISQLTVIQPLVLALAVPFIIVASLRNRDSKLHFNVSQKFIFRSGVIITSGVALLLVSLVAYSVRVADGVNSLASLILLVAFAAATIAVVAGSTEFQTRVRRLVSRLFYEDQRDSRAHWSAVTERLSEPHPDFTLGQQAIRAVVEIVDATSGVLWRDADGVFVPSATYHFEAAGPLSARASALIRSEFEQNQEVIDLAQEGDLRFSGEDTKVLEQLRFLAPLTIHGRLIGMIGAGFPSVSLDQSEVDQELIHLVGTEVAGFLALQDAQQAIAETRQFDAMNQVTTFLLHDIKTTTGQLNLLTENAERHKDNPEFIESMLSTIRNVNKRMNGLLSQLTKPHGAAIATVQVDELVEACLEQFANSTPLPTMSGRSNVSITTNPDKLLIALNHLLINAVEASTPNGSIGVRVALNAPWVDIAIIDNGSGMSRDFIETELFSPFRSTKGVAGMGIGVFQARTYIRETGGDLLVDSCPGEGSCFTVRLPLAD